MAAAPSMLCWPPAPCANIWRRSARPPSSPLARPDAFKSNGPPGRAGGRGRGSNLKGAGPIARKPNYSFERQERERAKANKLAEKANQRRERAQAAEPAGDASPIKDDKAQ